MIMGYEKIINRVNDKPYLSTPQISNLNRIEL